MSYFINKKNVKAVQLSGVVNYPLLNESHGCTAGFCSGIAIFSTKEYLPPGVHEDQEGFVVLEGNGWAKVGNEEYRLEPEVSFLAPAGVKHSIKRDPESEYLKVFWFHGAI